ncbi:DNA polymerase delta subunit 3-like isoform X3 [Mizuhopecten yessoensis]|uniref:DNA polymerase delta subunit 3-like isoform X3 n=1 Tax=Mizuhopecten yessoensis TaxID=6573 RepID=UPI000B45CB4B|nr:DNA polymerase delta subunit 3-like isoform X3 [Mizuhopecten yessoensis]
MATDTLYLENLEEYVNDENKIVTYRWFSTNLKVHVNQAKQMLYAFVQDQRNNHDNDNLSVTYFVAGLTKPVNGHQQTHKCTVVKEEDLEAYRSTLSVVTSSHIYSVQRANLKDSCALYTAEYDAIKESSKYTSIKFAKAKLRSGAEIESLCKTSVPQTTETNKQIKTNGTSTTNGQSKPAAKPQQKAGIAGMFAKAAKKPENKKEEPKQEKEVKENKPEKSGTAAKKGGMMSFFSKQTDKKPEQSAREETKQESKPVIKTEKKDDSSPPPQKKVEPKKATKKTHRKPDSDDESENKKKRRRIKQDLFDSSSEEEDVEIEDDSPVPSPIRELVTVLASDSEEEMEVTEPSPKKRSPQKPSPENRENGERRRKRTRRQVPKTFMDDDGYMVTEKVWESESTDASDVEPPPAVTKETPKPQQKKSPQKSPQKKSPQKKSPPTGSTKQKTMMSFFKKK